MPYLTRKRHTMEVDCLEKGNIRNTRGSLKKVGATKGDMAQISEEGDVRPGMDLGHGTVDVSRQTKVEILGEALMCIRHEED